MKFHVRAYCLLPPETFDSGTGITRPVIPNPAKIRHSSNLAFYCNFFLNRYGYDFVEY
jgi:hypothetical protein